MDLMTIESTEHFPKTANEKYSALVNAKTAIEPGVIIKVLM
jgi:hypothetical protein